ncbi:MAG: hypothetical protein HYZ22_13820 [Chloroflexi bacterium]|nr:hypothetical protein [Chloroflexota bacterium]
MLKKSLYLTAFAVLLAACVPAQPTVDIQAQVNTAVAQTMEANNRISQAVEQTVAAQLPANTVTASATFESISIFTDTPVPTLTPFPTNTSAPIPAGADVQQPRSCFVATIRPEYMEEIKAGASFEIRWQVKNTGTLSWDSGVDVKYASGAKMTEKERVEISEVMDPGETYKISITGKAPKNKGVQQMTWIVEGINCYANVAIVVK